MPYHVAKTGQCPVSKPWGVIKDSAGSVDGRCHATKIAAEKQMAALYAKEPTMNSRAAVSDKPWSQFTQADYDPAQWKRACLIDTGEGDADSKGRYKVPVKEPDGTLSRGGCHAAAGGHGISAVKGVSSDKRQAAARKLVAHYRNDLKEDPPVSLLTLAGESAKSADLDPHLALRDLDLVRAIPAQRRPVELRADDDTDAAMPVLVIRFSPFDVWYEVHSFWEGEFLERTVRGAFKKTMNESRAAVRILYDHGHDFQIGNKVLASTEDLREDPDSAVAEGRLFDTTYNRDLLPGLEAGAYGSSFRFRVIQDEWNDEPGTSDHNPKGLPERTIKEVRLFEAGPVTFPANPDATAGVRCMTDDYYERLRARDPQRYDELRARAIDLRTSRQDAAAASTAPDDGVARTTDDEPAVRHSHRQSDVARRIRVGRVLRGISGPTATDQTAAGGDPGPARRDRGAA